MQLAASRSASPDHIAVQANRAGRITGGQRDHLWSHLFTELAVAIAAVVVATACLGSQHRWLAALPLLFLIANIPRLWALAADVFFGRCDAVAISGKAAVVRTRRPLWPRQRHQLTWPNTFAFGDSVLSTDDDTMQSALQAMPSGLCYVARHTRLLISVAPKVSRNDDAESFAAAARVNDMAIGSIMHRLSIENDRATNASWMRMPVLVNTVRGDFLATAALVMRGIDLGRGLLVQRQHPQRRTADPVIGALELRGRPVRQSRPARTSNVGEATFRV
jgi:hypothetical protein